MFDRKLIIPILVMSLFVGGSLTGMNNQAVQSSILTPEPFRAEVVQVQDMNTGEETAVDQNAVTATVATADTKTTLNAPAASSPEVKAAESSEPAKTTQVKTNPVPKTTSSNVGTSGSTVSRGSQSGKVLTMVATAYDGCYECNKPYYGKPSYIGLPLRRGIVAVDPNVIPMGSRLYVEGYGEAIAADQGNAIKGNRIDLFFDTHQQALKYGKKTVKVTVY